MKTQVVTPPKTNEFPLKIDVWKKRCPFGARPIFEGLWLCQFYRVYLSLVTSDAMVCITCKSRIPKKRPRPTIGIWGLQTKAGNYRKSPFFNRKYIFKIRGFSSHRHVSELQGVTSKVWRFRSSKWGWHWQPKQCVIFSTNFLKKWPYISSLKEVHPDSISRKNDCRVTPFL